MNAVLGGGSPAGSIRNCANATDTPTAHTPPRLRPRHRADHHADNVSTESTGASIREILNEVAAIRDAPVSAEELQRAKDSLSLSLPADFVTGASTARLSASCYLANLPPDYFQNLPAAIAETTPTTSRRWRGRTCDPRR